MGFVDVYGNPITDAQVEASRAAAGLPTAANPGPTYVGGNIIQPPAPTTIQNFIGGGGSVSGGGTTYVSQSFSPETVKLASGESVTFTPVASQPADRTFSFALTNPSQANLSNYLATAGAASVLGTVALAPFLGGATPALAGETPVTDLGGAGVLAPVSNPITVPTALDAANSYAPIAASALPSQGGLMGFWDSIYNYIRPLSQGAITGAVTTAAQSGGKANIGQIAQGAGIGAGVQAGQQAAKNIWAELPNYHVNLGGFGQEIKDIFSKTYNEGLLPEIFSGAKNANTLLTKGVDDLGQFFLGPSHRQISLRNIFGRGSVSDTGDNPSGSARGGEGYPNGGAGGTSGGGLAGGGSAGGGHAGGGQGGVGAGGQGGFGGTVNLALPDLSGRLPGPSSSEPAHAGIGLDPMSLLLFGGIALGMLFFLKKT